MSTTISAKLVAEGVGFPRWLLFRCRACGDETDVGWLEAEGRITDPLCIRCGASVEGLDVCLDDPQTAFGLALRLDEWEPPKEHPRDGVPWVADLALYHSWGVDLGHWIARAIARLTQIGHDAAIRRALVVMTDPTPGTLAMLSLEPDGDGGQAWCLSDPVAPVSVLYHLPGITDSTQALAAIYEQVVGA